jgi:hypothetical protein
MGKSQEHMSSSPNKHGLSRHIRPDTKYTIRKESGFGCVICGLAITDYEHIDPEFADAKEHDPDKMCLLCGSCHHRVTRGPWSKDKVWQAKKDPWAKRNGSCHDAFDIGSVHPTIWLGNVRCRGMRTLIRVDDFPLLSISGPEEEGGPYRLSGSFFDENGDLRFQIESNEWVGDLKNWDIECVGRKIIVRRAPGIVAIQIRCLPSTGLIIDKLNMVFHGVPVVADHKK